MVALIPGASGGFGNILCELLHSNGMKVYGTCRHPDDHDKTDILTMLAMDICDEESVKACVETVLEREGRLDVVVNCVNELFIGGTEEQSIEEVRYLLDTNVLGALRVFQAALPIMRKQGSGTIVSMSSLGGVIAVPYIGAYTSAKFALEAMTEALYHEVRGEGIDVVIMQPVAMHMKRASVGTHLHPVKNVRAGSPTEGMVIQMAKDTEASKLTPELVARKVLQIIKSEKKPLRVPMDRAKSLGLVKRLVPQYILDKILANLIKTMKRNVRDAS